METQQGTPWETSSIDVSEGLNSVETGLGRRLNEQRKRFQKDLIVWKRVKGALVGVEEQIGFRRT